MKKSLLGILPMALLALTMSGCGKDNTSGTPLTPMYNPIQGGTYPQQTQQAYQQVMAWYQGAERPINPMRRSFYKTVQDLSGNNSNCSNWWIFSFCGGTTTSQGNTSYVRVTDQLLMCESLPNQACDAFQTYPGKANNVELQNALTGKQNTLNLVQTQFVSNGVYALSYSSNWNNQVDVVYVIDTNLHSLYNPIEVRDGQVRKYIKHQFTY